jgi:hypothetical protein
MKNKLYLFMSLITILCIIAGCSGDEKLKTTSTLQLFDGKTFNGWEGDLNWFRIEDGSIVAGSLEKEIPHNYFLCTTKDYSDFELKVEAKLVGEGPNSGVQFRSRRIPGETEVIGYQADIGGEIGDWATVWGSLYDESRRKKMLVKANDEEVLKVLQPDDWNEMILRCKSSKITIWVNGFKTVDYIEEEPSIEQNGLIGLQIHSGSPGEVWFRNLTLTEL